MGKSLVNLRPTTETDVRALYGKPLDVTIIGITGVQDGQPLGFAAIFPGDGCMVMISRICDDARQHLHQHQHARALLRAARALQAIAKQHRLPIRAVADRQFNRSAALLKHLGFRHIEKDVYEWTIQA